jgi:hypothetical protein
MNGNGRRKDYTATTAKIPVLQLDVIPRTGTSCSYKSTVATRSIDNNEGSSEDGRLQQLE